jgi:hypothetical protein
MIRVPYESTRQRAKVVDLPSGRQGTRRGDRAQGRGNRVLRCAGRKRERASGDGRTRAPGYSGRVGGERQGQCHGGLDAPGGRPGEAPVTQIRRTCRTCRKFCNRPRRCRPIGRREPMPGIALPSTIGAPGPRIPFRRMIPGLHQVHHEVHHIRRREVRHLGGRQTLPLVGCCFRSSRVHANEALSPEATMHYLPTHPGMSGRTMMMNGGRCRAGDYARAEDQLTPMLT